MKTAIPAILALFLPSAISADTIINIQEEIVKENSLRTDVRLYEVITERNKDETVIWLSIENYTDSFILYDAKLCVIEGVPALESIGTRITTKIDSPRTPVDSHGTSAYTILLANYKSRRRYRNSIVVRLKNTANESNKSLNNGFYIDIQYRDQNDKIKWVRSDLIVVDPEKRATH